MAVSIGANVIITEFEHVTSNVTITGTDTGVPVTGAARLPFNFESYYKSNNLKAGIYIYSNGSWHFQPR
jgi:integral membrane sensor domain MASE1